MTEIDRNKPVLVTGGAGYIASWIVKYLLEDGLSVRASVRDRNDATKVGHLMMLADKHEGRLELFEADLNTNGSFDTAMRDCELVIHTASPFFISGFKDAKRELVDPAVNGTRSVLEGANRTPSVKRIVLTSSVAAIMGDNVDARKHENQTMTEEDWNESSSVDHQPYQYSKTLAEREAWKIADAQDRWDLVTINPAFVLGPSLSERMDGTSVQFMRRLVSGEMKFGVPRLHFGIVDVRDVARAHILAGLTPEAAGRHILCADTKPLLELGKMIGDRFGKKYPTPGGYLPAPIVYLVGPFLGLSWSFLSKNLGVNYDLDNTRSREDLGVEYRSIPDTICEHVAQMDAAGLI